MLSAIHDMNRNKRGCFCQVIACAGDAFYIDRRFSKREYELIFGGVLMIFAFVPVRPLLSAPGDTADSPSM